MRNGQIYSILLFSHLEQLSTVHLCVSKEGKASVMKSCLVLACFGLFTWQGNISHCGSPYTFLSTEFRGVKHFKIPLDDVIQGYKFTIYHTYPHITVCMNIS